MGRSLFVQPALSVAYPKSFTPSVVNCVSAPVARSRTHRLSARRNAVLDLSGEGVSMGRARLPPAAGRAEVGVAGEHSYRSRLQFQVLREASTVIALRSAEKVTVA